MVLHVCSGICGFLFSRVRHPNGDYFSHVFCRLLSSLSIYFVETCLKLFSSFTFIRQVVIYVFAVVLFLGACTKPPRLSMITEYMELGSLYYLIHMSGQKKKLSWHRRLRMLREICRYIACFLCSNLFCSLSAFGAHDVWIMVGESLRFNRIFMDNA